MEINGCMEGKSSAGDHIGFVEELVDILIGMNFWICVLL